MSVLNTIDYEYTLNPCDDDPRGSVCLGAVNERQLK